MYAIMSKNSNVTQRWLRGRRVEDCGALAYCAQQRTYGNWQWMTTSSQLFHTCGQSALDSMAMFDRLAVVTTCSVIKALFEVAGITRVKPRYSPPHVTPTVEFWSKIKTQGEMRESNAAAERAEKEKASKQREISEAGWKRYNNWANRINKAKAGEWIIIICNNGVKVSAYY